MIDYNNYDHIHNIDHNLNLNFNSVDITESIIKTYVISDLHGDSDKSMEWIKFNCKRKSEDINNNTFTILILPGDIGTEVDRLEHIFMFLKSQYNLVCYIYGNHELWRRGTMLGDSTVSVTTPDKRTSTTNRMSNNSIDKFYEIMNKAQECQLCIEPIRIISKSSSSAVTIIPLYSWYHTDWDTEPDITNSDYLQYQLALPFTKIWSDFNMCSWPEELISQEEFINITRSENWNGTERSNTIVAKFFDKFNDQFMLPLINFLSTNNRSTGNNMLSINNNNNNNNNIFSENETSSSSVTSQSKNSDNDYNNLRSSSSSNVNDRDDEHLSDTIISFSHFLPRQELCPEKRFLIEPLLSRVIGSKFLENRVRQIKPHLHIYGHTHIPMDIEVEGNCLYFVEAPTFNN
jgi:predicted phosphodiesterase